MECTGGNAVDLREAVRSSGMSRETYELEVSLLAGALQSYRRSSVVNPFPKAFITADGDRDYGLLQQTVSAIPSSSAAFSGETLHVTPKVGEVFAFLRGLHNVTSIPVDHISGYINSDDLASLPQFVFEVQHDPNSSRSRDFVEHAKGRTTGTGFHGSKIENWFSILKNGLQNYSGTKKQMHGAVFGEGIYLSTALKVACDFSESGMCWKSSEVLGPKLKIVAMCEYVLPPEAEQQVGQHSTPPTYVIIPSPADVRLRYLLVYTTTPVHPVAVEGRPAQPRQPMGSCGLVVFYLAMLLIVFLVTERSTLIYLQATLRRVHKTVVRALA